MNGVLGAGGFPRAAQLLIDRIQMESDPDQCYQLAIALSGLSQEPEAAIWNLAEDSVANLLTAPEYHRALNKNGAVLLGIGTKLEGRFLDAYAGILIDALWAAEDNGAAFYLAKALSQLSLKLDVRENRDAAEALMERIRTQGHDEDVPLLCSYLATICWQLQDEELRPVAKVFVETLIVRATDPSLNTFIRSMAKLIPRMAAEDLLNSALELTAGLKAHFPMRSIPPGNPVEAICAELDGKTLRFFGHTLVMGMIHGTDGEMLSGILVLLRRTSPWLAEDDLSVFTGLLNRYQSEESDPGKHEFLEEAISVLQAPDESLYRRQRQEPDPWDIWD